MKSVRGIADYQNKNIIFLSTDLLERDLLFKNPQLKKVTAIKLFPRTIRIELDFQRALANLEVSGGFLTLSEDGRIMNKNSKIYGAFPSIQYYQKYELSSYDLGQYVSLKDITVTLTFLKKLAELNNKVEKVDINGPHMIVFNVQKKSIIFSADKDLGKQLYQLETLIHQFTIEGKEFKSLDLRFDKPIVTF